MAEAVLRSETLTAGQSFTIKDNWLSLSVTSTGGISTIIGDYCNYPIADGESVNIGMPQFSFDTVTITAGAGATCKMLYF